VKSKPAVLPLNTFVLTANEQRADAFLPMLDFSLPQELMPETVLSGGMQFSLNNGVQHPNALLCNGQTLEVPAGAKAFCFIGCALGDDKTYTFQADDTEIACKVQNLLQPIGKWDLTDLGEAAAIKRDPLAFSLTHTHGKDGDNVGQQSYFFRYTLPLQKAKTLTLPVRSDLLLLSGVFCTEAQDALLLTELYDSVAPRTVRKEDYSGEIAAYRKEKVRALWRRFF
jgi:hypothetical protein